MNASNEYQRTRSRTTVRDVVAGVLQVLVEALTGAAAVVS